MEEHNSPEVDSLEALSRIRSSSSRLRAASPLVRPRKRSSSLLQVRLEHGLAEHLAVQADLETPQIPVPPAASASGPTTISSSNRKHRLSGNRPMPTHSAQSQQAEDSLVNLSQLQEGVSLGNSSNSSQALPEVSLVPQGGLQRM